MCFYTCFAFPLTLIVFPHFQSLRTNLMETLGAAVIVCRVTDGPYNFAVIASSDDLESDIAALPFLVIVFK